MMKRMMKRLLGSQLTGFACFLLLWQILHLLLNTHTIPAPLDTIAYFVSIPLVLLKHAGASILRVAAAVGVSLLLGIPSGLLLGVNPTLKRLLSPLLYFIYPIPKIAFLPVFMLLFGLGNASKILMIIFIIVFQIMLSVRDGVAQISPVYFKVMDSFCVSPRQRYRFLIVPAMLPQLFSGLRISIGISLASLFFAENYATQFGIGYFILGAWTKMNYEEMFSGILMLGFIGILLFYLLDRLESVCIPWQKGSGDKPH
jgi:ABC-type nitrate/sulfonate/bicarbonate transport system permease component